jgi:formylglycine-generating enzyme required for sulfatase activity
MRRPIIYLAAIVFLFFGGNLFTSTTQSQNAPFTMGQILRALSSIGDAKGEQKRVLTERVLGDIRQHKVNFQLTKENEDLLRVEGATDEFIEILRQNSLVAPGQAPAGEITNSIGMEFVRIPVGRFMMGSPKSEKDRRDDETQHRVTISEDFYMGKYEVTQAQWESIMGDNPSYFKNCPQCPVERVSWDDTQEFIKKLNSKNDGKYRLPTEAEWEYSARAGTSGAYAGILDSMAWHSLNSDKKTRFVGTKRANDWGLYDMHGNVWEFVQDWYEEDYYKKSLVIDPAGPESGTLRIGRGGGWFDPLKDLRAAIRFKCPPTYRSSTLGFRLVRE